MIIRNIVSIDLSLSLLFQNKRYWREFRNYYHLKIQIIKMLSFTIIFIVELNVRYSVNMDYEYISMRINCVIIGTLKIKREMTSQTIEKCPWFLFNFHESTIWMKMIFSFLHYLYCNKKNSSILLHGAVIIEVTMKTLTSLTCWKSLLCFVQHPSTQKPLSVTRLFKMFYICGVKYFPLEFFFFF